MEIERQKCVVCGWGMTIVLFDNRQDPSLQNMCWLCTNPTHEPKELIPLTSGEAEAFHQGRARKAQEVEQTKKV